MDIRGMCYAVTDDGVEVPVIDVTHPGFRVDMSAQELAAATEKAVADVKSRSQVPPEEQQRQLQGLSGRDRSLPQGSRPLAGKCWTG